MFINVECNSVGRFKKIFQTTLSIETPIITLFIKIPTDSIDGGSEKVKENQTMETESV